MCVNHYSIQSRECLKWSQTTLQLVVPCCAPVPQVVVVQKTWQSSTANPLFRSQIFPPILPTEGLDWVGCPMVSLPDGSLGWLWQRCWSNHHLDLKFKNYSSAVRVRVRRRQCLTCSNGIRSKMSRSGWDILRPIRNHHRASSDMLWQQQPSSRKSGYTELSAKDLIIETPKPGLPRVCATPLNAGYLQWKPLRSTDHIATTDHCPLITLHLSQTMSYPYLPMLKFFDPK